MSESVTETKDWSRVILDQYQEGASDAEVASHLGVTLKEYHKQIGENAAFGSLIDKGRTLCLAFWEGQARKNINNKLFNTSLWSFYMKNKFGWADKTEQIGAEINASTDLDSLREKVMRESEAIRKRYAPEITDATNLLRASSVG